MAKCTVLERFPGEYDAVRPKCERANSTKIVTSLQALSDLNISAHKEAFELIPLCHKIFEMVTSHFHFLLITG